MPSPTLHIPGHVTTTARVNLRQGQPSRTAPVLRKIDPGVSLNIAGVAVGDEVQGNAFWYQTDENAFVWAGACGPFASSDTDIVAHGPAVPVAPPPAPAPLPAPAAGMGLAANVIDIYHGDRVTSFAQARTAGVLGVIHKATTGQSGRDDAYRERRSAARDAGLLWGAYHWGTDAPAATQVENFLTWAEPDENTLVALDYETDIHHQMSLDRCREFLRLIEEKLGRKAVLYSGSLAKDQLGSTVDPFLGAHRLWLAQYGPTPRVQRSWSTFWLWQYTDGTAGPPPHRVAGIPGDAAGRLDCDYYPGSAAQLAAEWAK